MPSYYEDELTADALSFLPEDIRQALLKLADFQHKTGTKIEFDWFHPRQATSSTPVEPEKPCIKFSNIPRKTVLKMVTSQAKEKKYLRGGGPPQLFLSKFTIDDRPCLLWVIGDREKNIRDAIHMRAEWQQRREAEFLADQLVRQGSHPMGELDFTEG